jgi:predicted GIY-YIG superfamily endonuclease
VRRCGDKKCHLCEQIIEDDKFYFDTVKQKFTIKYNMSCSTKYCIYVLICKQCKQIYIGETSNLRLRMNLHKQHIGEEKSFKGSQHMAHCGGGTFLFMPILKMHNDDATQRKEKELKLIRKYRPQLNVES